MHASALCCFKMQPAVTMTAVLDLSEQLLPRALRISIFRHGGRMMQEPSNGPMTTPWQRKPATARDCTRDSHVATGDVTGCAEGCCSATREFPQFVPEEGRMHSLTWTLSMTDRGEVQLSLSYSSVHSSIEAQGSPWHLPGLGSGCRCVPAGLPCAAW